LADTNRKADQVKAYLAEFQDDWEADEHNRDRARDDLEFSAGEQWDANDKSARESEGRPCLTINRLPQFIRQVVGDLRDVKPSISVRPNGNGADEDTAEVINGILRNIEDRSKDEQPYTVAVESAVRCGIGHFRITTDHLPNNPFAQDIFLKPIHNPLAVVWDYGARSITRADAKHVYVREGMTRAHYEKEFPGAKLLDFGDDDFDHMTWQWIMPDMVMIAERFSVEEGKAAFIRLEGGAILRRDRLPLGAQLNEVDGFIRFIDGRETFIEETAEAAVRKIKWCKFSGGDILDEGEWPTEDIPIVPVIGEEVHFEKTKLRAGLIRWAKDPQRLYNFWRSTQTEVIGSAPKAPYMVGASQIAGFEEAWLAANKGNKPFLPFNDKENPARPSREVPPQISSGMQNEIALAADDMKATTGIYDASLGNRSNETAGVAIRQRQKEGDVSTNFFGDNLAASMRRAGRIIVDLIPIVYDTQRAIRIVADDLSDNLDEVNSIVIENGLPKVYNDLTVGDYDVTVNIGPSYATKRQEALEGMALVLQGQPFAQYFLDLVAKNSDWPGADQFAERAKKLLPQQLQDDDEEPTPEEAMRRRQEQQLSQIQIALQMAGAEAEIVDKQAKAQKTAQEAEGVELDNVMKKLDLSALTGAVQQAVMAAVVQALAGQAALPSPQPTALNGAGPLN